MSKKTIYKVVTIASVVIILCMALYIMLKGLGLNPDYDFGAGAYYYADDPAIQNLADREAFVTSVPKWVHYLFFFAWGALMWALWKWVDRKD